MRLKDAIAAFCLLLTLIYTPPAVHAADEVVMGVFPRRNAVDTARLFTPLADYLGEQLGRKVVLQTAKDFDTFWQGVEAGSYDIVHYNQYHYIVSSDSYQVIASNQENGKDDIAGAIYVRRDSGISELSQLRGKTIIFGGGRDAMMSYIVPRYLLQQGGLQEGDFTARIASNPLNAVLSVFFRQAEAGGAGDVVMHLPKVRDIAKVEELQYLALSEPIRHLPWCVRKDLAADFKARIRELLTTLDDSETGQALLKQARLTGINPASDSDYDSARTIINSVFGNSTQVR